MNTNALAGAPLPPGPRTSTSALLPRRLVAGQPQPIPIGTAMARPSCACSAWPAAPSVHQQVDGAESDREELLYGEFVESIAAVAAYRKVNPYIPFYQRLEKFLADDLLPAISLQANSRVQIHAIVKPSPY